MNFVKKLTLAVLACLFLIVPGAAVVAQPYGEGNYGECLYGEGCPTPTPTPAPTPEPNSNETNNNNDVLLSNQGSSGEETVVTTPDGLEVAINLQQGQKLPSSGYTVIITPLNGKGTSFERVEIFIDGKLITVVKPDSTGTAKWFWDTLKYKGTNIRFVIYDKDGTWVAKEFNVTIEDKTTAPTLANTKPDQGFWQNLFDYLASHPWLWAVIVFVPLLIWLIVFLLRRSRAPTNWQS